MFNFDTQEKILIIDDDISAIKLLANILDNSNCNYNVVFSRDGLEAVKIAEIEQPDLILLDVIMTKMSGFEVCSTLKNNQKTSKIPIIFITGVSDIESESYGFKLGAADFIVKPYYSEVVLARIKNQIQLSLAQKKLNALMKNCQSCSHAEVIE